MSHNEVFFFRDLETDVDWEDSEPFLIEPGMTKLAAGQTKTFRAIFRPTVS